MLTLASVNPQVDLESAHFDTTYFSYIYFSEQPITSNLPVENLYLHAELIKPN